jgi:putative RNA 2'-phosphotransferase
MSKVPRGPAASAQTAGHRASARSKTGEVAWTISRRLSLELRHRPEAAGLTLNAQGWVPVADLLTALSISRADLDLVVAHNDKSRFAITVGADGVEWIRASQGHSRRVPVDLGLPAVYPPQVLFHGTPVGNVDAIRRDGLRG